MHYSIILESNLENMVNVDVSFKYTFMTSIGGSVERPPIVDPVSIKKCGILIINIMDGR